MGKPIIEGCFGCGKELTYNNCIRVGCFANEKLSAVIFMCKKCWRIKKKEGGKWILELENLKMIGEVHGFHIGALEESDN
jgi:hypothetical protein